MKTTIIGGGGRVGSNAAFALQCGAIVSEIQILDANADGHVSGSDIVTIKQYIMDH